MMKLNICVLCLLCITNMSLGQTLNLSGIRKSYDGMKPDNHSFLLSKHFVLISDSVSPNQKKFVFKNSVNNEIVEQNYSEIEGAQYLNIKYFVTTKTACNNFIADLIAHGFKYSKRGSCYNLPTSSYSGEIVWLKGMKQIDGKNYFELDYTSRCVKMCNNFVCALHKTIRREVYLDEVGKELSPIMPPPPLPIK